MLRFKEFTSRLEILIEADQTFPEIIEKKLSKDELKVSKKYDLPKNGGKFEIARKDQASFLKLFSEIPNKGAGNGEVSLYWLFNYQRGTDSERCKENRGRDNPDLTIDSVNVEVKSYPSHTGKIGLGKTKQDYVSREILSALFGFRNMFIAFGTGSQKNKSFFSEIGYNINDVRDSLIKFNEVHELLEKNPKLIKQFKLFKEIQKSMKGLKKAIGNISSQKKIDLTKIEETAADIAANIVIDKTGRKPGDGGFVVNILKGSGKKPKEPLDIMFHKVAFENFTRDYKDLQKYFGVSSGELAIDYRLFEK
jgi:uncharacterized protein YutE (UPF0331/DUF86 family)